MTNQTKAIEIVKAVAEAIRDLKEVPSGHLYAQLSKYMSLDLYNTIISQLEKLGLIKVNNHLITWVEKEVK